MPRLLRREENRVPLPGWRGTYFKDDAEGGMRELHSQNQRARSGACEGDSVRDRMDIIFS